MSLLEAVLADAIQSHQGKPPREMAKAIVDELVLAGFEVEDVYGGENADDAPANRVLH
jgi:hypothetical protein